MSFNAVAVAEASARLVVNRAGVASLAFLVYDACLTFPHEVAHIWSKPWTSLTKWVFLLLRYYTIVVVLLIVLSSTGQGTVARFHRQPYCKAWYAYEAGSLQVVTGLMEIIMMLRVYALYNRSRAVLIFLLTFFAAEFIAMAGALAYVVPRTEYSASCIAKREPIVSIVYGVAPVAFELTMLVMTWTKALQLERVRVRAHGPSAAPPLLFVLVRDGTWTFAAVFLTLGLNGLFYLIIRGPLNSMAWTWQFVVAALAGCRLVLHTHACAARTRGPPTSGETDTLADDEYDGGGGGHGGGTFALTTFGGGFELELAGDTEPGTSATDREKALRGLISSTGG